MKVYLVISGCRYDGTGVDKVFSSREKAEEWVAPRKVAMHYNAWVHLAINHLWNYALRKVYKINKSEKYVHIDTWEIQDRLGKRTEDIKPHLGMHSVIFVREWEVE